MAFLLLSLLATGSQAEIINSTTFDDLEAGTVCSRTIWANEGFSTTDWDDGLDKRSLITNEASISGEKSLRIMYPAHQFGPDNTGVQVPLLFTPRNEAYMSYWIRFSDNFSFGTTSYGGKLPGLCGGNRCSGGATCDGTNGFSARFMWRVGGKIKLYLYDMDKTQSYGVDYPLKYSDSTEVTFERGKWYHLMERVKINTDGNTHDGEVEAWVNGQHVLLVTGLRFTSNGDKVDDVDFSTFHGGDDDTWCPTDTCYTYFDNLRIGTTAEDVAYLHCTKPDAGPDLSLCGTGEADLEVQNMTDGEAKFVWTSNHQTLANSKTMKVTSAGQYIVTSDSDGCYQKDTIAIKDDLRPELGPDQNICSSSFITLNAGLTGKGLTFLWSKDGVKLNGITSSTLTTKDEGSYTVTVSGSGCPDASDTIKISSGLLKANDVTGQYGKEVTISVQGDANSYNWYLHEDDATAAYSGATYTTTLSNGSQYIYVSDPNGYDGLVGKKSLNSEASYTNTDFTRRMEFETFRPLNIDSITVYPTATQDVTIRILKSDQSTVVSSITHKGLTAGENRLFVGASLSQPGTYYMDAVGTTAALRHSNADDKDIHFPYAINGLISIKGSNVEWINNMPYYLYFFNWRVTAGNHCARTPIRLTGTGGTGLTETASKKISCYPSAADRIVNISGLTQPTEAVLYDINGILIKQQTVSPDRSWLQVDKLQTGNYIITLTQNGKKLTTLRFVKK